MGFFDWVGSAVKKVGEFVRPIATKVGDLVKPIWDTGKKYVAPFVPGASQAMDALEGIGKSFVEGAEQDVAEAEDEIRATGQKLRNRGNNFMNRTAGQWDAVKKIGADFLSGLRNPKHYSPDDEEEEVPRPKRRGNRRRRRRPVEDEEFD
jgi:hypothetical protein